LSRITRTSNTLPRLRPLPVGKYAGPNTFAISIWLSGSNPESSEVNPMH
jgi:hypothetical protein